MIAKYLIAAAAVLVAGSASAGHTYPYVDHGGFAGTKERAEARAGLAGAGDIRSRMPEFADAGRAAPGKARDEVRAELDRAHLDGSHASNRMTEFVDFRPLASGRGRDWVRAQRLQAASRAHGSGS